MRYDHVEEYEKPYYAASAIGQALGLDDKWLIEFVNHEVNGAQLSAEASSIVEQALRSKNYESVIMDAAAIMHQDTINNFMSMSYQEFVESGHKSDAYQALFSLEVAGWPVVADYLNDISKISQSYAAIINNPETRMVIGREWCDRAFELYSRCDPEHPIFSKDQNGDMVQTSYNGIEEMLVDRFRGCDENGPAFLFKDQEFVNTVAVQIVDRGALADQQLCTMLENAGYEIVQSQEIEGIQLRNI